MRGAVAVIICSIERSRGEVFYRTYRLVSSSLRDRAVRKVCILSHGVSSSGSPYFVIGHRCTNRVSSPLQRNLQLKFHWKTWFVEGGYIQNDSEIQTKLENFDFYSSLCLQRFYHFNQLGMSKVSYLAYLLFEKIGSS